MTRQTIRVSISEGFPVYIDRLIIEDRRLIYLSMLGDKTSLDASWAFIKNRPRRLISIGTYTIKTEKMEHQLFKSPELPSGGHHWMMVNRRASWLTVKPNETNHGQTAILDFACLDRVVLFVREVKRRTG